jgi:succinyl-CoA synthetase beta subunit
LVVKPDQLIKRRGKLGLIKGNVMLQEAKDFIFETLGKEISVRKIKIIRYFDINLYFLRLVIQQEN